MSGKNIAVKNQQGDVVIIPALHVPKAEKFLADRDYHNLEKMLKELEVAKIASVKFNKDI